MVRLVPSGFGRAAARVDVPPFAVIAQFPNFNLDRLAHFLLDPHPKMPESPYQSWWMEGYWADAFAARSIKRATSSGLETYTAWLAGTSMVSLPANHAV